MPKITKQGYRKVKLESNTEGITQETLVRVKKIAKMIAKGKTRLTCIETACKNWDVGEAQGARYYKAALDYLAVNKDHDKYAEEQRVKLVTMLEQQVEDLSQKNSIEARRVSLTAADLIGKLNSLYTQKQELNVTGDVTFEFGTPDKGDDQDEV